MPGRVSGVAGMGGEEEGPGPTCRAPVSPAAQQPAPGSPPGLGFSLETRGLPKLLGSLGYGASICLVALPHHPGPFSRSGISESSGSQITREGEQTPPSPAHQDLSDPLPFLHSPSCSSASLPSALPVLPDNSQPSSLASRYF